MSVVSITVTVPATTANLGPGFDCIGAALTLYNRFKFSRLDPSVPLSITVTGVEASRVKTDESNLVYQSVVHLYQHLGQVPPPLQIEIQLGVPLSRGLGSSATAIVGGLVGANWLAGSPLDRSEVMKLAIALEGHPDNVVPALLGGCYLAARGLTDEPQECCRKEDAGNLGSWVTCNVPWDTHLVPVVAIPDFELSTQEARRVLPTRVSLADAIFNTAHLGLLVRGLETGREDLLRAALQDRLHQRYRQELVPGYSTVYSAAMVAGACGMVMSGAGPTLLALVDETRADDVASAMAVAWKQEGIVAEVRSLSIDTEGARSY